MKNIRFYLEHESTYKKKKKVHTGNVVAIYTDTKPRIQSGHILLEGFASVSYQENSPVNFTSIDTEYLRNNCKRISEKEARQIHPALFERLD
jgi:hypothetical protein